MRFACPNCQTALNVAEAARGTKGLCPNCGQKLLIPGEQKPTLAIDNEHRTFPPTENVQQPPVADKLRPIRRLAPTPWLALIFILGLLPWTEVSCNVHEVNLTMTQSGYQALYGGASSPSKVMEVAQEAAAKKLDTDQDELTAAIEMRKSDFLASCSPLMTAFWAAALALVPLTLTAPGKPRLRVYLTLTAVMTTALIAQFLVGLPIDRSIDEAIHMAVKKNPDQALVLASAVNSSVTIWLWLALAATILLGITELAVNGLWRQAAEPTTAPTAALAAVAVFMVLGLAGAVTQVAVWVNNISGMEKRLDELERPERERVAGLQAAERERQKEAQAEAERQRLEAEMEAQAHKEQAEREWRQAEEIAKAAAQEAERRRLEDEKLRLENEKLKREADKKAREERGEADKKAREEQERQDAINKAERERKAAAEAVAKKREDERRRTVEMQGLAYYPPPTTLYEGKNAEEWNKYIKDPSGVTDKGIAALASLSDEGMPYLLDLLNDATDQKSHNAYLLAVQPEYVHPNDLPKIIDCLSSKWSTAARIVALTYLSKRKESKDHYDEIAIRVDDIKTESNANGSVKKLLEIIAAK